jgi:hypothetical protein
MKVTLDLPEIPGYEYTGEFRPPVKGEVCLMFGKPVREQEKYNTIVASYPIMRAKEKPKIVIYQWLIKHDSGYRVLYATEDYIVGACQLYGWTYKKFNPSPLWSLDGDTL